jgi:Ca2+-binding RTX toxin-like protein
MTNPILLFGSDNPDTILGTDNTDNIDALAGDDTIFGTQGDDTIVGGLGIDTYDYSYLSDTPITASLDVVFEEITFPDGPGLSAISGVEIDVDKGLSNDSIVDSVGEIDPNVDPETVVGTIIAPVGLDNTFQTPSGGGTTDLSRNLYESEGGPRIVGGVEFTIENFVNVIGNGNPDNIIGDEADNRLEGKESVDFLDGGAGDDYLIGGTLEDTLVGGEGSDTLVGGDPVERDPDVSGFFEEDILTGGVGSDLFILGDSEGDFYAFGGDLDFATIEDFSAGDRIQLSSQETYSIQNSDGQFEIFAVRDSGEDLVARVTLGDFA